MIVRSRAPLRLGLAGGGTDVSPYCDEYGGAVLNATIDQYAYASLEDVEEEHVEFVASDLRKAAIYEAKPVLEMDGKMDILKHVYNYVVEKFNEGRPMCLRIQTWVDVPAGSGLGGSSTLVVALLKAFAERLSLPLSDYEIAHTAYEIERVRAKLLGGKQDQYAAAFGGFNFMEFGKEGSVLVNQLRIKEWVIAEVEASMTLFYTGESRSSAKIIEQQVSGVEQKDAPAIEAMHRLKQEAMRMKECLMRGDIAGLATVLRSSWNAKQAMARGIVNDRIQALYDAGMGAGATCAKISGAGGGGFMMFLSDPMDKLEVSTALRKAVDDDGTVYAMHFTSAGAQTWRIPHIEERKWKRSF